MFGYPKVLTRVNVVVTDTIWPMALATYCAFKLPKCYSFQQMNTFLKNWKLAPGRSIAGHWLRVRRGCFEKSNIMMQQSPTERKF